MEKPERIKKKLKSNYRHGDLKNGLVQAALQLVQSRSNVEFTIRELAGKTGVTHTAAYRHFKSKNEIMRVIAAEGFGILHEYFKAAIDKDPADIVSLGVSYVRFAVENTAHFRVMFHPDLKSETDANTPVPTGGELFSTLKTCVEYNQKIGTFSMTPSLDLSITAWALVHGVAMLWTSGNLSPAPNGEKVDPKKMAKSVCEVLTSGLKLRVNVASSKAIT
jgi:AcrR family transcriptional regulator